MSDDLADFFEENTHWVDSKGNTTSVKPPKPPKSRREMRRRRNVRRRKTIIVPGPLVAAGMTLGRYLPRSAYIKIAAHQQQKKLYR